VPIDVSGDPWLLAHKAKYHELHAFDLTAQTWDSTGRTGMPFIGMIGRKKKSKDGGSAAVYDNDIYALKGGNTQEFWYYDPEADTWEELDTMPAFGSAGRKKRVKHGADIVLDPRGGRQAFYALKGNKTREMWLWAPGTPAARPARSGVAGLGLQTAGEVGFDLLPNPSYDGRARLRFTLPSAGPARFTVFDVSGRTVATRRTAGTRTGTVALGLGRLSAGIYLVKLETDGFVLTRKLVVGN
jgi:hypothetical protein